MAYIRKSGKKWRAEIERNGTRKSATFNTKAEASLWATKIEADILLSKRGVFPEKTLVETMHKYADEVSASKKGQKYELLRLALIEREYPWLSKKILYEITPNDISEWINERSQKVTKGTIQRELNLLSSLFNTASKVWGWCESSPISNVKRPAHEIAEFFPTRSKGYAGS